MPDEDAGNDEDQEEAIDHTAENARGTRNAAGPLQIFGAFCAGEAKRVRLGDAAECVFHVPRLGAHREDDTHRAARGAEQIGSKQRQKDDYGADAVHLPVEEPGEGAEKYRPAPGSGSVGSDAHPLVDVKIGLGVRTEEGCEIGADLRVSALHPAAQLLADVVDCDAHESPPPFGTVGRACFALFDYTLKLLGAAAAVN